MNTIINEYVEWNFRNWDDSIYSLIVWHLYFISSNTLEICIFQFTSFKNIFDGGNVFFLYHEDVSLLSDVMQFFLQ